MASIRTVIALENNLNRRNGFDFDIRTYRDRGAKRMLSVAKAAPD